MTYVTKQNCGQEGSGKRLDERGGSAGARRLGSDAGAAPVGSIAPGLPVYLPVTGDPLPRGQGHPLAVSGKGLPRARLVAHRAHHFRPARSFLLGHAETADAFYFPQYFPPHPKQFDCLVFNNNQKKEIKTVGGFPALKGRSRKKEKKKTTFMNP